MPRISVNYALEELESSIRKRNVISCGPVEFDNSSRSPAQGVSSPDEESLVVAEEVMVSDTMESEIRRRVR